MVKDWAPMTRSQKGLAGFFVFAGAMHFGDADDPHSNISQLLAENQHFRMHQELGTGPNIHYLWDKAP